MPAIADRLRIALLVESSSAGVGRHVIDLAFALHELGHSIDLLYSTRRIDARFSRGLAELAFKGVKVCEIDMHHGLHLADVSSIGEVRRYLRINGPFDIVHTHSTKAGLIGRVAALGLDCHTLYTPHGLVTSAPFRSRGYRFVAGCLERGLATLGDAVLCVSKEERDNALQLKLPCAKLYVIQNGIDLSEAEQYRAGRPTMRRKLSVNEADVCVGFVARMIPGKAPGVLLEAFALAVRDLDCPVKCSCSLGVGRELCFAGESLPQLKLQDHVILATAK